METLVKTFPSRFLLNKILVLVFLAIQSCDDSDKREDLIPGKFAVVWDKNNYTKLFTEEQKIYYSNLTLEIYQDHTFKLNFDFDNSGRTTGEWKFSGSRYKKLLHLNVKGSYWVCIDECLDTGGIFTYPLQTLGADGQGICLTFKKVENYH